MSSTASTPPPGRFGKLRLFFGSSAIVGLCAVLALALSLWQIAWPAYLDWRSPYAVEVLPPDLVNLFCAGSEGIDAKPDARPVCDGLNGVVLIATPLAYLNKGTGDKAVWLRREIVRIRFEDEANNPVKDLALAWERTKGAGDWQPPTVEQIDVKKATSHSSLFYPSSFGCGRDVKLGACIASNTYHWSDLANDVLSGRVTHAVLTFAPEFEGPTERVAAVSCELALGKDEAARLQAWRDQIGALQAAHPDMARRGAISPPYAYVSGRCLSAAGEAKP